MAIGFEQLHRGHVDADAAFFMLNVLESKSTKDEKHCGLLPSLKEVTECGTARHRPGAFTLISKLYGLLLKRIKRLRVFAALKGGFSSPSKGRPLEPFIAFLRNIKVRTAKGAFARITQDSRSVQSVTVRVPVFVRAVKELGFTGDVLAVVAVLDRETTGSITYVNFSQCLTDFLL